MPRNIREFFAFEQYDSRADYAAKVGKEAPVWNPLKPRKYWHDPAVAQVPRRFVSYDVAAGQPSEGPPYLDSLRLLREEAVKVNIPPEDSRWDVSPFPEQPELRPDASIVARPIKLAADEYLAWDSGPGGMFGKIVVWKKGEEEQPENIDPAVAAQQSYALLKKIAAKLGV